MSLMSITIDFNTARTNHIIWMTKLQDFLDGKQVLSEEEVLSCHDCDLGKWLYGDAITNYSDILEMPQLQQEHMTLHENIKQVINQKNSGNPELASQTLAGMQEVSKKIIDLLNVIEEKVKEKEAS